jgi:hypothetical protein
MHSRPQARKIGAFARVDLSLEFDGHGRALLVAPDPKHDDTIAAADTSTADAKHDAPE